MASLLVLSTVASASIGNMNFFENATASEKYSNKYENSNGYANYESYGANYYQQPNYYYTQDRQYEDKQNSYLMIIIIMINIINIQQKKTIMSVEQVPLKDFSSVL